MEPWRQARPYWDRCAGEILKAAKTGTRSDIVEATRSLEVALRRETGCDMPRGGAIIFRDLVAKLDVLNIECDNFSCATGAPPQHSKPFFRRAFVQAPRVLISFRALDARPTTIRCVRRDAYSSRRTPSLTRSVRDVRACNRRTLRWPVFELLWRDVHTKWNPVRPLP